ncbi:hypothetical protein [Streptomyces hawaiiensis]|uniref:hypothetical protein n=1 Tax=Streptomyces hawaiiensis TaxID=67305 RepID=UPI003651DF24
MSCVYSLVPHPVPARPQDAELFAAQTGFDPRRLATPYPLLPRRATAVQAWRKTGELDGRELMCDGRWLKTD